MEVSTASGVCSQSGIVKMAFAFAAASRKSSTDLVSAADSSGTRAIVRAKAGDKIDKHKLFMAKGLIDEESEHCVEDLSGKAKTQTIRQ
jgi:hypothetical protein